MSSIGSHPTVAVVGGGITGLAAARALLASTDGVRVVLVEAERRLGGKIRTRRLLGRPIEAGPEAILTRVPWATELCTEVGLGDQLVAPDRGNACLWSRRRLRRLPPGLALGFPTSPLATLRSRVLSPRGALRASADLVLPRRMPADPAGDVAVGSLVRYRFGRQVLERLVEPLLGGVHAGPVDDLSLRATVPHIDAAARQHRSLTLGLRAGAHRSNGGNSGNGSNGANGSAPKPPFVTVRDGLSQLVTALLQRITDADIVLGQPVERLRPQPDGGYLIDLGDRELAADAVVLAVPAFAAADLLEEVSPAVAGELGDVGYSSVTTVALAYPPDAELPPDDVSGFLVAPKDRRTLTGCSLVTTKWPHLRPADGGPILRCTVTGDRSQDLGDDELVAALAGELRTAIGLATPPRAWTVTRWPRALPHYTVGHLDRVARIRATLPPTLTLAGAAYGGVGIPDCIRQGQQAAAQVVAALAARG